MGRWVSRMGFRDKIIEVTVKEGAANGVVEDRGRRRRGGWWEGRTKHLGMVATCVEGGEPAMGRAVINTARSSPGLVYKGLGLLAGSWTFDESIKDAVDFQLLVITIGRALIYRPLTERVSIRERETKEASCKGFNGGEVIGVKAGYTTYRGVTACRGDVEDCSPEKDRQWEGLWQGRWWLRGWGSREDKFGHNWRAEKGKKIVTPI